MRQPKFLSKILYEFGHPWTRLPTSNRNKSSQFLSFSNVQIRTKNRNDPLIPSSRGITNQRNLEIDSWTKLWTVTSKQKFLHRRDLHRNLENILKFRFSI